MSTGYIRFAIAQDMFADTVDTAIPITQFTTSDAKLAELGNG